MERVIKNLTLVGRVTPCAPGLGQPEDGAHGVTRPTWNDDCSGIANVEAKLAGGGPPAVVGLVIVAAAFVLGMAAGALITSKLFH